MLIKKHAAELAKIVNPELSLIKAIIHKGFPVPVDDSIAGEDLWDKLEVIEWALEELSAHMLKSYTRIEKVHSVRLKGLKLTKSNLEKEYANKS
jgi:hypothetical protein